MHMSSVAYKYIQKNSLHLIHLEFSSQIQSVEFNPYTEIKVSFWV